MKNWPIDTFEHLAEALREQGESPEQAREMARVFLSLQEWQVPLPSPVEKARLVNRLMAFVPVVSPVRRALRKRHSDPWSEFSLLLKLMSAQVSLLRPAFWLTSAVIVLLGGLFLLNQANLSRSFVLQMVAPLLSYLGAATVFRGIGLNLLEIELACLPSPRQLTFARLVIVLGYDIGLGLILSLALWTQGGGGLLMLTLHWLAPLLLVFGLTLFLSLRMQINQAAAISYIGWLALLLFSTVWKQSSVTLIVTDTFTALAEVALSLVGLLLLSAALSSIPTAVSGLFPRR